MNPDTPIDDGLYVNAGDDYGVDTADQYYDQPLERTEEEQQQAAIQQASYPIMGDVAEWFDQAVASLDSFDNINEESKVAVEVQMYGLKYAKGLLESKAEEFERFRHER